MADASSTFTFIASSEHAKLTVPQLKALCKDLKITGYSKLGKAALLEKLSQHRGSSTANTGGGKALAQQTNKDSPPDSNQHITLKDPSIPSPVVVLSAQAGSSLHAATAVQAQPTTQTVAVSGDRQNNLKAQFPIKTSDNRLQSGFFPTIAAPSTTQIIKNSSEKLASSKRSVTDSTGPARLDLRKKQKLTNKPSEVSRNENAVSTERSTKAPLKLTTIPLAHKSTVISTTSMSTLSSTSRGNITSTIPNTRIVLEPVGPIPMFRQPRKVPIQSIVSAL
ncbi:hypothetical protein DFH11DRAFT_208021 [Phellopilus nigrolimitatus]|nr:hypothetical protein DFH11DRAFT_208021 [Phellopilus nigrolimitatus]